MPGFYCLHCHQHSSPLSFDQYPITLSYRASLIMTSKSLRTLPVSHFRRLLNHMTRYIHGKDPTFGTKICLTFLLLDTVKIVQSLKEEKLILAHSFSSWLASFKEETGQWKDLDRGNPAMSQQSESRENKRRIWLGRYAFPCHSTVIYLFQTGPSPYVTHTSKLISELTQWWVCSLHYPLTFQKLLNIRTFWGTLEN